MVREAGGTKMQALDSRHLSRARVSAEGEFAAATRVMIGRPKASQALWLQVHCTSRH
jgi:hypothetical protein